MSSSEPCDVGYHDVDAAEGTTSLIASMDATARWDATRRLRAWERRELRLLPGERLLDVGCGTGDAALDLAGDLGRDGRLVGIDTSSAMLTVARQRSPGVPCSTTFAIGDAGSLAAADDSFDAVRSERTLQWVRDPQRAVSEFARVLRSGGRASLIDTDWSTLDLDIGDRTTTAMVSAALATERHRPSNVGRRLSELAETAGLDVTATATATQTWVDWDPAVSPAPSGCFSMRSLADDLIGADELDERDAPRFVDAVHDAARRGRFAMSLTMHAIIAIRR